MMNIGCDFGRNHHNAGLRGKQGFNPRFGHLSPTHRKAATFCQFQKNWKKRWSVIGKECQIVSHCQSPRQPGTTNPHRSLDCVRRECAPYHTKKRSMCTLLEKQQRADDFILVTY
jgi:hypothetical protein